MSELKPCPFCGGEAQIASDYSSERDETRWNLWHECNGHEGESNGCGYSLHPWFETPWYKTEAEAIAAWNERAPVEYDGWFYLPKPKESVVEYGEPRIRKTENGYKAQQTVEVIESAIRSWGDELGDYIMKRICKAWGETCDAVRDERTQTIVCSKCGGGGLTIPNKGQKALRNFCPNCGARIRKAVER